MEVSIGAEVTGESHVPIPEQRECGVGPFSGAACEQEPLLLLAAGSDGDPPPRRAAPSLELRRLSCLRGRGTSPQRVSWGMSLLSVGPGQTLLGHFTVATREGKNNKKLQSLLARHFPAAWRHQTSLSGALQKSNGQINKLKLARLLIFLISATEILFAFCSSEKYLSFCAVVLLPAHALGE